MQSICNVCVRDNDNEFLLSEEWVEVAAADDKLERVGQGNG